MKIFSGPMKDPQVGKELRFCPEWKPPTAKANDHFPEAFQVLLSFPLLSSRNSIVNVLS